MSYFIVWYQKFNLTCTASVFKEGTIIFSLTDLFKVYNTCYSDLCFILRVKSLTFYYKNTKRCLCTWYFQPTLVWGILRRVGGGGWRLVPIIWRWSISMTFCYFCFCFWVHSLLVNTIANVTSEKKRALIEISRKSSRLLWVSDCLSSLKKKLFLPLICQ